MSLASNVSRGEAWPFGGNALHSHCTQTYWSSSGSYKQYHVLHVDDDWLLLNIYSGTDTIAHHLVSITGTCTNVYFSIESWGEHLSTRLSKRDFLENWRICSPIQGYW